MISFDWSLKLSDLVIVGSIIGTYLKMQANDRTDRLRVWDVIGSKEPPKGILGDIRELSSESTNHRNRLIDVEAELNLPIRNRS